MNVLDTLRAALTSHGVTLGAVNLSEDTGIVDSQLALMFEFADLHVQFHPDGAYYALVELHQDGALQWHVDAPTDVETFARDVAAYLAYRTPVVWSASNHHLYHQTQYRFHPSNGWQCNPGTGWGQAGYIFSLDRERGEAYLRSISYRPA